MAKNVFGGLGIGAQNTKKTQPKAEQMQGGLAAILEDLQQKTTDLQQTLNQAQGASSNQGQSSAVKQQTAQKGHGAGSAQQNANIQSNANGQQAGADEQIQSVLGKIAGYGKEQKNATNDTEAQPKSIVQLLAEMQQKDKEAQDKSTPNLESTLTMGLQDWANENEGVTTDKDNKLFLDGFLENKSELINGHGAKANLLNDQSLSDIFVTAMPEEAGAEETGDEEKGFMDFLQESAGNVVSAVEKYMQKKQEELERQMAKGEVETLTVSTEDSIFTDVEKWYPPLVGDTAYKIWDYHADDGSHLIKYTTADGTLAYRAEEPTIMKDGTEAYKIILSDSTVIYQNPDAVMSTETAYNDKEQQEIPIYNFSENRSKEAYIKVLESFDVAKEGESRYRGNKTYCNFYIWDVTTAMGCEIPLLYKKSEDGTWVETDKNDFDEKQPDKYSHNSATTQIDWLRGDEAKGKGWETINTNDETEAVKEILALANEGYPIVAGNQKYGNSHVAMVAPQEYREGMTFADILIYQAGAENFENKELGSSFSEERIEKIEFFVHM